MDQVCDRCHRRMYTARKSPHPTLWPQKILARYERPNCGMIRECIENVEVECVDIEP